MGWKDEINNAKKVFRNGKSVEIVEFLWAYYKWHLFILMFVAIIFGSVIHTKITAKDCVLSGIILNVMGKEEAGTELEQDFLVFSPIDTEKEEICFDTSFYYSLNLDSATSQITYQTLQMLTAQIASGDIDFMVGDLDSINNLAYKQFFYELSEVLTEDRMKRYEPYFLYYDRAFADQLRTMDTVLDGSEPIVYPDPRKPELMEEPVPILIDISECTKLLGVYPFATGEYVMAFALNSSNLDKAIEFLEYLME